MEPAIWIDSFAEDDLSKASSWGADSINYPSNGRCSSFADLLTTQICRCRDADQVVKTAAEEAQEEKKSSESAFAQIRIIESNDE